MRIQNDAWDSEDGRLLVRLLARHYFEIPTISGILERSGIGTEYISWGAGARPLNIWRMIINDMGSRERTRVVISVLKDDDVPDISRAGIVNAVRAMKLPIEEALLRERPRLAPEANDPLRLITTGHGLEVPEQGTGWLLNERIVVTALHVVGGDTGFFQSVYPECKYTAYYPQTQKPYVLHPLDCDPAHDLALLTTDEPPLPGSILNLADTDPPSGAPFMAFGFPGLQDNPRKKGRMETIKGTVTYPHPDWIQLLPEQGTSIHGVSGAAVQVSRKVVGVVSEITAVRRSVDAIPIRFLKALAAKHLR